MSDLKPCPFCGGEAFVNEDPTNNGGKPHISGNVGLGRLWSVECDECGADGGYWQGSDIAIKAWNTRAERTCHIETRQSACGGYTDHCSECGADLGCDTRNTQHYCPNCGARVTPKCSETTPKVVEE